jgi:hypothetical protein
MFKLEQSSNKFAWTRRTWAILVLALCGIALLYLWHPVCVPIAVEDLKAFTVSIDQLTGEHIWGVQTFQKRDGQWYQCKPWLARQMFF